MRKATVAKLSLTALVGICSFVGQANIASAGPGPQQGSIKVAPTTSTTMKPIVANPVDYCDTHLCLEAAPVDPPADEQADQPAKPKGGAVATPQAEDGCPSTNPTCPPPGDECPLGTVCPPDEDDCVPIPGAADCPQEDPCDDGPQVPRVNDPSGQPDPCDPCESNDEPNDHAARSRFDECDPCDDGPIVRHGGDEDDPCDPGDPCDTEDRPEGPKRSQIEDCDPCLDLPPSDHAPRHGDTGGDDCGGTDGSDGTTDGHDGRLPHTGADVASMALVGLGLTGIGAAVKRLGRKASQQ